MIPTQSEILKLRINQQQFVDELTEKILQGMEAIPELISQGYKHQASYLGLLVEDLVEMRDDTLKSMAGWPS